MATKTQVIAPLATFVAVAGIVAAAAFLPDRGTERPPMLNLTGTAGALAAQDSARTSSGDYQVTGPLPQGQPDDAPIWTLEGSRDLTKLRAALGNGVTMAHNAWWWSSCSKDLPMRDDTAVSSTGCAVATPISPEGATPAPKPVLSKDAVRAKAEPIFDAVGLDVAKARVETSEYGGSVSLTPPVGVLSVVGWTTRVDVGADMKISNASGFVSGPTKGAVYPLITAQEAVDQLPGYARMAMCMPSPDGKGCIEPPAPEITAGKVGLQLVSTNKGEQLLVPAWLFTLKGSEEPLAQIAVDPAFLGTEPTDVPEPGPTKPGQTDPGGGGSSGDPGDGDGSVPPDGGTEPTSKPEPPRGDPGPPPTADDRKPLAFDRAFRGSTPASVIVEYGNSGSCPHRNVTHQVKETPEAVYIVLEADAFAPDQVCTDDYQPVRVTVKLADALGDRKIYDGTRSSNGEVELS